LPHTPSVQRTLEPISNLVASLTGWEDS
jgi:hypothetical protein